MLISANSFCLSCKIIKMELRLSCTNPSICILKGSECIFNCTPSKRKTLFFVEESHHDREAHASYYYLYLLDIIDCDFHDRSWKKLSHRTHSWWWFNQKRYKWLCFDYGEITHDVQVMINITEEPLGINHRMYAGMKQINAIIHLCPNSS